MSMAGIHITEDCAEVYLQNESGMEFLQLARRLHDYLQQGQRLPARSLFEATDDCKEISREAFDALAKHRMENTGEVSGVFELDFDARTLSALNIMDGWKVYAMQEKRLGAFLRQPCHFCPQCGQFWAVKTALFCESEKWIGADFRKKPRLCRSCGHYFGAFHFWRG